MGAERVELQRKGVALVLQLEHFYGARWFPVAALGATSGHHSSPDKERRPVTIRHHHHLPRTGRCPQLRDLVLCSLRFILT